MSSSFFQSYLFSFIFWSDFPLGALPLLMVYHLTGGDWGIVSRRILEALTDTIWAIALFFIPIFAGLQKIYPWMDPSAFSDLKTQHQQIYLNSTAFIIRTPFYFLCWLGLNFFLQRNPRSNDHGRLSAGGLVLIGLVSSFAAIDWQMSVEHQWSSTIYGMIFAIGQTLGAYAFSLMIFGYASKKERVDLQFPKKTLLDLGNILLTLIMVWAYLSFMQYLIVWSGNLPDEATWFSHRTQGGWQWVAFLLFLFQFALPFVFLLFRNSKDKPLHLAYLGLILFLVRVIDHLWMLFPAFKTSPLELPWQIIPTWLGMGAIWFFIFLKRLSSKPIFESYSYGHSRI